MNFLDVSREPIFAQLATDPKFSQTANEILAPRSYGERHHVSTSTSLAHPENCSGCAPHRLVYLASQRDLPLPKRRRKPTQPIEAVITDIQPGPGARRAVARAHGPQSKRRRSS